MHCVVRCFIFLLDMKAFYMSIGSFNFSMAWLLPTCILSLILSLSFGWNFHSFLCTELVLLQCSCAWWVVFTCWSEHAYFMYWVCLCFLTAWWCSFIFRRRAGGGDGGVLFWRLWKEVDWLIASLISGTVCTILPLDCLSCLFLFDHSSYASWNTKSQLYFSSLAASFTWCSGHWK